jgi:hypothetical protein
MASLTDSSAIGHDPERLRRAAAESGYLFFRSLVPPAAVGALRDRVLAVCEKIGWLAPERAAGDAVARPGVKIGAIGEPSTVGFLAEVLSLPEFVALGEHPSILAVLRRLLGASVATRRGDVCRAVSPASPESTTPPHQDAYYVRDGADLWTAWLPLGDCPRVLGGLAIVPGSHRGGLLAHANGGAAVVAPGDGPDPGWATADYCCGDVLMFGGLTVHAAGPNASGDRLRLSVDYRYQPATTPHADLEETR